MNTDGAFIFACHLFSDNPGDDSWGVLHLDFHQGNGALLWSSSTFWSPTIQSGGPPGDEWAFETAFPIFLFDYVSYITMHYHC
jgi:hypothetical protein